MKGVTEKTSLFIYLLLVVAVVTTVLYLLNKELFPSILFIPNKPIFDYVISITGFFITALGFYFVVLQVSALSKQINNQEEQYHKDSEFKNFLEATKMLTSVENKDNPTAQISAMYLLYDYAKKYPVNNLEKVMKVLNRYATPAIYNKSLIYSNTKSNNTLNIVTDKKTINEWKEYGEPYQQVAITALEINKKLFVYAVEHKIKINLSDIVIFDLDIEKDFNEKSDLSLSLITNHSPRITFLLCNFSNGKREFKFSRDTLYSIKLSKKSVKGRLDISLSYFINCDLKKCDFSYSNLWGVTFKNCELDDTKFYDAECSGSEFISNKISEAQLKEMLFIDKDFFKGFRKNKELKYAVVCANNENCFNDREEYEGFVKYKNETKLELQIEQNILAKTKQFICQKLCKS